MPISVNQGGEFITPVTTVDSTGFKSVWGRIEKHRAQRSDARLLEASRAGAEVMEDYIVLQMRYGPKTGRKYSKLPRRSSMMNTNPNYTPEFPAVQSEQLIRSLEIRNGGRGIAELVSDDEHAMWMEFGFTTKDGTVHYRPFMRTALAHREKQIRDAIREVVRRGG